MQWGHIKTLFILSFLILNIYLIYQFLEKQQDADLGILFSQEATIEDQLAADNISLPELDMDIEEETYILASQKVFDEHEIKELESMDNQRITIIDGNFIISELENPIPISDKLGEQEVSDIVKSNIFFSEEFAFWDWNKELNIMLFFQKIGDRTFYYNEHGPGLLLVYLNEKNEITHYTQSLLDETETQGSASKSLIKPIQAIESLYNSNDLHPNEEVTKVSMGYYSRLIEEGEQVFAPTWNITVNNERNYFINAIEGFIFTNVDTTFLDTVIEDTIFKVQSVDEDLNESNEAFLEQLKKKQQLKNRSEIENDVTL